MIRPVQEDIANQMRSPPHSKNAVMQLNMGEGKSSVIVPIVAAALADGAKLVRVLVAKPQSKQMYQMLVSKLGGMLNRQVYRMPFSRTLRLDAAQVETLHRIYRECMATGGILLVQPEDILSFKLMAIENVITGQLELASSLLGTQFFFDSKSRDIVDESDENYSTKFELIYTMGLQKPVEYGPERWIIVQEILSMTARLVRDLQKEYPLSVEVDDRWKGGFPRIRLLSPDVCDIFEKRLAEQICKTGLLHLPIPRQSNDIRQGVMKYIVNADLSQEEISAVEKDDENGYWNDTTIFPLLLVRGLVAGGVLRFALSSKRWRVNYGLDLTRAPKTRLALPFRAKDNPTLRSEFSHTDVIIILTSLSYYYGGLDNEALFLAFAHLFKSDQAQVEYDSWVRTAYGLNHSFRQLASINMKDKSQCLDVVFPALRYSKGTIDYFLSHCVFSKELREFPHKISASGHDIGQTKPHPTTGFSGTNDSRFTLPLAVDQLDLENQKHTNALVLEYILQAENSVTMLPQKRNANLSEAARLLALVTHLRPEVRVILDVGAQILELDNLQVAKKWLSLISDHGGIQAVVFVDDADNLSVVDRRGTIEPIQISPYATQLDLCLVFLDEAHTRGIDLKLPKGYRAAVTLGANLTKDRLVQACMRMRQLGKGQSVTFCVSQEIETKILERRAVGKSRTITVVDVLEWSMHETCVDLRRSMPLWATQGLRHEAQKLIWDDARTESGYDLTQDAAKKYLEDDAQSLEQRYKPSFDADKLSALGIDINNANHRQILERCQRFEALSVRSSTLQEEQERELSPEIEQERQNERPARAKAETHSVHPDVTSFVTTGQFLKQSSAFIPAFSTLRQTSAGRFFDVSQFRDNLYVTVDFGRTIKVLNKDDALDAYQRPIQFILTTSEKSKPIKEMLIISPFEAQELLPQIREHKAVTLHLYAPRSTLGLPTLDTLNLFTEGKAFTPKQLNPSLIIQLNLFAGQLYMSSFKEYKAICEYLGLAWRAAEEGMTIAADGFIISGNRGPRRFKTSPVKFLHFLMTNIRRQCEGIERTHVGKMLQGGILEETDFDE